MSRKAYLILENGTYFEGESFGAEKETTGELVFTTSMVGYLETLTDPSYYGQVVVQTFPLFGNYGVIPADFESETPVLNAYICRSWCQEPSNFRCQGDLDTFFKTSGVPGLCGIDTRALTKILRDQGVMNCKITYTLDNLDKDIAELKAYEIKDAVKNTSTKEMYEVKATNPQYDVVVIDMGAMHGVDKVLVDKNCNVTVVPYNTPADAICALNPDGIVISDGPGNPTENTEVIETLKALSAKKIPMFGISLGHQVLALAQGAKIEKLVYGHRGSSQPAKALKAEGVYITSQNHNYTVVNESLPANAELTFVNSNDSTCEGIEYTDMPAFSVQFLPIHSGGPRNTALLFDRFTEMMEANK